MGDQPPIPPSQNIVCGARGEMEVPLTGPFPKVFDVPWATALVHPPIDAIMVFWEDGITHLGIDACPNTPASAYGPGASGEHFSGDYGGSFTNVQRPICKTVSSPIENCNTILDPLLPPTLDYYGVIGGNNKVARVEVLAIDATKVSCRVIDVMDNGPTGGVSGDCLNFTPKMKICEAYVVED